MQSVRRRSFFASAFATIGAAFGSPASDTPAQSPESGRFVYRFVHRRSDGALIASAYDYPTIEAARLRSDDTLRWCEERFPGQFTFAGYREIPIDQIRFLAASA